MKYTRREAIEELVQYDHGFLTMEGARNIAEPFGIDLPVSRTRANTGEPKGLVVLGARKNEAVEGWAADALATYIADRMETKDRRYCQIHGRGTRLRCACEAILAEIGEEV